MIGSFTLQMARMGLSSQGWPIDSMIPIWHKAFSFLDGTSAFTAQPSERGGQGGIFISFVLTHRLCDSQLSEHSWTAFVSDLLMAKVRQQLLII